MVGFIFSLNCRKNMDFSETEIKDMEYLIDFSDSDEEIDTSDNEFIEERDNKETYMSLEKNMENYSQFFGQTKNSIELISKKNIDLFGDDDQPELFDPEDRENVEFDNYKTKAQNFKASLKL